MSMSLAMGLSLTAQRVGGVSFTLSDISPAAYDFAPERTFTDAGGTTNATYGDNVARTDALSGGGQAYQTTEADRPTLQQDGGEDLLRFNGVSQHVHAQNPFDAGDTMSMHMTLRTDRLEGTNPLWVLVGRDESNATSTLVAGAGDTVNPALTGTGTLYIGGVRMWNTTRDEFISTLANEKLAVSVLDRVVQSEEASELTLGARGDGAFHTRMDLFALGLSSATGADAITEHNNLITLSETINYGTQTLAEAFAGEDVGVYSLNSDVWQDTAGTIPAGAGDDIARIDPIAGNSAYVITQPTEANRPTLDPLTDLISFNPANSENLPVDVTQWTAGQRATMYAAIVWDGTDADFALLAGSTGAAYLARAEDTSSSATIDALSGSPTYWLDTERQSWADRDAVHTSLSGTGLRLLEVEWDATNAAWDTLQCGGASTFYASGKGFLVAIGPKPIPRRQNQIRNDALTKFGPLGLTFS